MILPYVYLCTHRETGEFYIGYRSANKVNASDDLGAVYRSSAHYISSRWDEFDSIVVAEFFSPQDAWLFEQEYIYDNRHNKLILNRSCHHNARRMFIGPYRHSDATKQKMSASWTHVQSRVLSRIGRSWEDLYGIDGATYRREIAAKKAAATNTGRSLSDEHIQKLRDYTKTKPHGCVYDRTGTIPWNAGVGVEDPRIAASVQRMVQARKDKQTPTWNKGRKQELVICPHCGKTGGHISMKRYHFDKCAARIVENFLNTDLSTPVTGAVDIEVNPDMSGS